MPDFPTSGDTEVLLHKGSKYTTLTGKDDLSVGAGVGVEGVVGGDGGGGEGHDDLVGGGGVQVALDGEAKVFIMEEVFLAGDEDR